MAAAVLSTEPGAQSITVMLSRPLAATVCVGRPLSVTSLARSASWRSTTRASAAATSDRKSTRLTSYLRNSQRPPLHVVEPGCVVLRADGGGGSVHRTGRAIDHCHAEPAAGRHGLRRASALGHQPRAQRLVAFHDPGERRSDLRSEEHTSHFLSP